MKSLFRKLIRYCISKRKVVNHEDVIFIVGSGRSGTSLLRSMLWSLEWVAIPPENFAFKRCLLIVEILYFLKLRNFIPFFAILIHRKTGDVEQTWAVNWDSIKIELSLLPLKERVSENVFAVIYKAYGKQKNSKAKLWGDKTPNNTTDVDIINMLFPNAKFIHLVRNPTNVAKSYLNSGLPHYNTLNDGLERWYKSNLYVENIQSKLLNYLLIKYENLVMEPENTLELIGRDNDLEISDLWKDFSSNIEILGDLNMLEHHKNVGSGFLIKKRVETTIPANLPINVKSFAKKYNYKSNH